ncbi:MAG TPA: B12-binding domain-containing radical SAM protein [Candidatus Eubacterium avistercoris]|uniref:B12-binding domain-containing radical SAM protein n=1 Tax=Candidatus Eubacterium avistercoris TaxID=2838567 RepID=A0A9D2IGS6_9FIRM|nr:B12-binding domain-containing radical SAM protein [Candidatus Eubacterium avistercoris]
MKIVLTAINAKYIHSNPAVYSLRAYAGQYGYDADVAEFTINQRPEHILRELYRKKPDVLCFSCYIWNIEYVKELAAELKKLLPDVEIWAGGPEVSFETVKFMEENPAFRGVMIGEGEETFLELIGYYTEGRLQIKEIKGVTYRGRKGEICTGSSRACIDMDRIPFYYEDLSGLEHKIIYYESSRGCPYSCSYCLSSVDKKLRFKSLEKVFRELGILLDKKVPQIKFVDRTFNCRREHASAIWRYITEHDNGVTNFHFEISADLLTEEDLELMRLMRPGLIQLEIGVQTVYEPTIREIRRTMDLPRLKERVERIHKGGNIHQHLDLIAGLPFEDYETFQRSFNEIYALRPQQLQLGFLKVLKGSYMYEQAGNYGLVSQTRPPYEVYATKWLTYDNILDLKLTEEMVEVYYNSSQYRMSLGVLETCFATPYEMFWRLGNFYQEKECMDRKFSRMGRCLMLLEFAGKNCPECMADLEQGLLFDLYARENMKSRPAWAEDLSSFKAAQMSYLREKKKDKKYCHFERFDKEFLEKYGDRVLQEIQREGGEQEKVWLLFDYEKRDPLTYDAHCHPVDLERYRKTEKREDYDEKNKRNP